MQKEANISQQLENRTCSAMDMLADKQMGCQVRKLLTFMNRPQKQQKTLAQNLSSVHF
jgi:hypothetical protein